MSMLKVNLFRDNDVSICVDVGTEEWKLRCVYLHYYIECFGFRPFVRYFSESVEASVV